MSADKRSPRIEELISTGDDTFGTSISLSINDNSVRIKEKAKPEKEVKPNIVSNEILKEKWWLKKPDTQLVLPSAKLAESATKQIITPSPDVSSSMKEFLEKEKMCKAIDKNETEVKDKDDTLCDVLASNAFDKYTSDFENATDEDIGSIFEEMNKIAGTLSSNSLQDFTKSGSSAKNLIEEEKSVEELLEEAERLVKKTSSSLSKSASKSDTLVPDNNIEEQDDLNRVRQLEIDIFQLIEEEVNKQSEIMKKSPRNESRRESNPEIEVLFENIKTLKAPKSLELQKRKFEEQKVEVSSSSDLDDPIERHSKSEDIKKISKMDPDKHNLRKEIIDVDKDFFENLLKKSTERAEGGMSGSSSFGQEDFSHFLKLLQNQNDNTEQEPKEKGSNPAHLGISIENQLTNAKTPEFPEKEITEILNKELPQMSNSFSAHDSIKIDSNSNSKSKRKETYSRQSSRDSVGKFESVQKHNDLFIDGKKIGGNNELYNVDLTPRLELFADAIPKLIAERSIEDESKKDKEVVLKKSISNETINIRTRKPEEERPGPSKQRPTSSIVRKPRVDSNLHRSTSSFNRLPKQVGKSKSYDQLSKQPMKSSLENLATVRSTEGTKKPASATTRSASVLKSKLPSKILPKYPTKPKPSAKPPRNFNMGSASSLTSVKSQPLKSPDAVKVKCMGGGDTKENLTLRDWEILCREERHKNSLLKRQIESEAKQYKSQIDSMRVSFEEELFALKKENIILKAKMDEMSINEKRPEVQNKNDTRVSLLEKELEKQESLIRAYETENKKLIQDTKHLQEEMKMLQQKQKSTVIETNGDQNLKDRLKDLEEETLKLKLEVSDLKQKNTDFVLKNDDLGEQNALLNDELEMFKEQLLTKNSYINSRLQAMTNTEMELKKQVEDLTIKLNTKTEHLRLTKLELDKLQENILPLEKELLEVRVREEHLQEKLKIAKSHVEREKQLTQKLKDQVILDSKRIMDLNRQVREMERILKRKNPDSVSALILTANAEKEKLDAERMRVLENKNTELELRVKQKEEEGRSKIQELQVKFAEMTQIYTTQIASLEEKILEMTEKEQKVCRDVHTQTTFRPDSKSSDSCKKDEKVNDRDQKKSTLKNQNSKEETHLIATIRGLQLELSNKDKNFLKVTKELQELLKTNKRLQKEREKLLNERKVIRSVDLDKANKIMTSSDSRLTFKTVEANDQNSNVYQNGHTSESNLHRLTGSTQRLYDPLQYTEPLETGEVKRLTEKNEILKDELEKLKKDFMALKNKRLHDLNLLQEEHEREMATLMKEYNLKYGDSKITKLQSQLSTQVAIISHLKQQIEKLRDYKEQVIVLKAERDHLENKVKSLTDKVKYLSSPSTEQLQLLQDKITILQQRHESREMTLQNLVRDLLRSRTQCKDCQGEKRQLCYFRQELDHILGMLQEIANIH